MAKQLHETVADAIAAHKREKQALTKEFYDHCRNASPNHTAFCCQWCTDNGDARVAIDNLIAELSKELGA